MDGVITLILCAAITTLITRSYLRELRSEINDVVQGLKQQIISIEPIYNQPIQNQKTDLQPLLNRLARLEETVSGLSSRIIKLESTPERKSQEVANSAIEEILKSSW